MTFRELDYTEMMLLSGVLAKHLELAFKEVLKDRNGSIWRQKKKTVIS